MPATMYDSIDITTIPASPQAVAGYVGGHWPTYAALVAKFPKAHHLSIAVNASQVARCLDIEPGDAINPDAINWLRTKADRTHGVPVLYTSASNVQTLVNELTAAGFKRGSDYLIWSAHYTHTEHVCGPHVCGYPQADGTQWTDKALGRNLDQSLLSDAFFPAPKPPPPPWCDYKVLTGVERDIVWRYDAAARKPKANTLALVGLRAQLRFLAGLVWAVAHTSRPPSWGSHNRGTRYQMLIRRAQGQRLA